MPYTQQRKQYLEAMGLVPWIDRNANVAALVSNPASDRQTDSETGSSIDTGQNGIIESVYQGRAALVHGEKSASLLLIFQANPGQSDLTLSGADNRLLLDMLKAIGLDESSVARCLVDAPITAVSIEAIAQSASYPLGAAVLLVTESPDIASDDQAASRVSTELAKVPAWRLPHPVWIQREPSLKRRAWNVLKAVKVALNQSTDLR